jgi:hypothetical protein
MPFATTAAAGETDAVAPLWNETEIVGRSLGIELAFAAMNRSWLAAGDAATVTHETAAGPLSTDTWPTASDSGFAHRSTSTVSGSVPFALSAWAVMVTLPGATAVMTPPWSTVATAGLLEVQVGVFDVTSSPFELMSLAVAVIVVPTCIDGDGAPITIDVTVVGEGAVGPSLQALTKALIVSSEAASRFMEHAPKARSSRAKMAALRYSPP